MDGIKSFLPKKATIYVFMFLFITFSLFELLFRSFLFGVTFEIVLVRVFLYTAGFALMTTFIFKLLFKKVRTFFMFLLIILLTVLYLSQTVYYSLFGDFLNVSVLTNFAQATSFSNEYFDKIRLYYILYFMPLFLLIFVTFTKRYKITGIIKKNNFTFSSLMLVFLTVLTTLVAKTTFVEREHNILSDKFLYNNLIISERAVQEFGLLTFTALDIKEVSSKSFTSNISLEEEQMIEEFLNSQQEHQDNEMTGIFEDKNLILIMAESLDKVAVREDVMPNLYRMQNEGMYFENFYSPLYSRSTSDTEFMTQTSMLPNKKSSLSMGEYLTNTFPNTFGNMFREKDYNAYSFHNYSQKYYPRKEFYEETLGYNSYYGSEELGIEVDNSWPSDIELIEKSVPNFINEEQFFVKMITVSGHLSYNDKHSMVKKNIDVVKDIDESEDVVNYFATQVELDNAIGLLVDEVEKAGKLDDTVIMVYSDHRPYGLTREKINSASEIERANEIDVHSTPFIIWGGGTEQKVISKPIGTIDLMPTISNMFNLDMKYEYAFGADVFQDRDHVIQFSTFSWVGTNGKLYSSSKEFVPSFDTLLTIEEQLKYKDEVDLLIYRRAVVSQLVLRSDYYQKKNIIY